MIKFYDSMGGSQGIAALIELVDACDFWQDGIAISVGDVVRSSSSSMIYAECMEAGTTGGSEPSWSSTEGAEITDGTVKWVVHDLRNAKNAESAAKLKSAPKINGIEFDGSKDIELPISSSSGGSSVDVSTYIGEGLKVTGFNQHEVYISSGNAQINGKAVEFEGGKLTIDQRETALMHLDSDGKLGKVSAKYPTDRIDDYTLGCWVFNKAAGENVPNIAVGKSSAAVKNDFIQYGVEPDADGNISTGVVSVDGWADYALQTDGSTGYLELQNNTGFVQGDKEWEVDILITIDKIVYGKTYYLFNYSGSGFNIYINSIGALNCFRDETGYFPEAGKTFLLSCVYNTETESVYIDGKLVYQDSSSLSLSLSSSQNSRIGCSYDSATYKARATYHYLEIRKKARTQAEIAQLANELLLPCFYNKPTGDYPELQGKASVYNEWKFDDDSAKNLTDTNGSNNGVSGGSVTPTKKESPIGLGNVSYFSGSSSCYYDLGTMEIPQEFTFVAVVNPSSYSSYNRIFGNKIGTTPEFIISCYASVNSTGYGLSLYTGSSNGDTWITSSLKLVSRKDNFIAIRVTSENIYFRVNGQTEIKANTYWTAAISTNAALGAVNTSDYPFKGTMSYVFFSPKALPDAAIDYMYDKMMVTGRRNITFDSVPTNAAAIGFIRADSDSIIEYNDTDYKYGRREGATGGNRKVFLGYKYFSGSSAIYWENPFGTSRLKKTFTWAFNSVGDQEIEVMKRYYYNSEQGVDWSSNSNTANEAMKIYCNVKNTAVYYRGYSKTSGYIGCYAEVMEDYKGIDGK